MLSIGEFSKICYVTTKTLRYYDEIGLIKPVYTNNETGYRYYDISQLELMLEINKLKSYEISLEEIAGIIRDKSGVMLLDSMRRKETQLKHKKDEYDFLLLRIKTDIENLKKGVSIMSQLNNFEVKLMQQPQMNILYTRQIMSMEEFGKYCGKLFERIARDKLTMTGALFTFYHDSEFNPESSDVELAIPIKEAVTGTRDLPAQLCAMIRHEGLYSELPSAYAKIMEWIEKEGYEIAESPYDCYVTNPAETKPEENITEIYFPVKKK